MPMTESQWPEYADPAPMLECMSRRGASERKFRLFSAACARRVWPVMSGDHVRRLVLDAEQFADGRLSPAERRIREEEFRTTFPPWTTPDYPLTVSYFADMAAYYAICAFREDTIPLNQHGARYASQWAAAALVYRETGDWQVLVTASTHPTGRAEHRLHCRLLRCLFGNPFRPSPPLPPALLAWNDGTVRRVAEGIYEEREMPAGTLDTARLAVLADALLDAGCEDEELIRHCRREGPHVRGCWAIDHILGKS
jgi:hypothetical protein